MVNVKSTKYVLYFRVSTQSQGSTGHGIEAQRRDINLYLNSHGGEVVEEFVEVMSGGREDRPELQSAIDLCKKKSCTLLVSKLDRLSRDVEFVARLCKDKKLSIKIAQIPNADNFQIHLFAALAEQEREFISQRTKAALAAAKARGVVLGNPKIAEINRTRKRTARKVANQYAPIVLPLRTKGLTYLEIAGTLNQMGIRTSRGKEFKPTSVKRIVDRASVGGGI